MAPSGLSASLIMSMCRLLPNQVVWHLSFRAWVAALLEWGENFQRDGLNCLTESAATGQALEQSFSQGFSGIANSLNMLTTTAT